MKIKLLLLSMFFIFASMKSDKPAYRIFDKRGELTNYKTLIDAAAQADIVFFGEQHNNPICHWLELQIEKDLYKIKKNNLILGAEMFETDNSLILKEYLSKQIRKRNFEEEAKLWPNYKTDYKPLINFARDNDIKFVATNIPRRYAAVVHKKGFEGLNSLSPEAKKLIAPLPIKYDPDLNCYKQMLQMMGNMGSGVKVNSNLPKAQAIKDATMAYFILKNWKKGKTFLHFNGSYHSDNFQGIVWYLKQKNPDLKILTITSVEQDNIDKIGKESIDKADFIICIPDDMTKTY